MSSQMNPGPRPVERAGGVRMSSEIPSNGTPQNYRRYVNVTADSYNGTSRAPNPDDIASGNQELLKILIAPSGFKESLGPEQIADAIEAGVRRVFKQAFIHKLPLHDGGEGFCKALVSARHGFLLERTVTGPLKDRVQSHLGFIDNGETAVLDMAAAAGLRLVPKSMRNPLVTTTYGVGQLIRAALDQGCRKIIIGCGDSGTSDGGAGMLQALGVELLDGSGAELPVAGGGGSLTRLCSISWDGVHPRLRKDAGKWIFNDKISSLTHYRGPCADRSCLQHQKCFVRSQRRHQRIWAPERSDAGSGSTTHRGHGVLCGGS